MKKLILGILTFAFLFISCTSLNYKANAAALSEDNSEVDSLFVEVGAELLTLNDDFTFSPGPKADYLAEFDSEGNCIKAGFKLIALGDNVANKYIYVYDNGNFPGVVEITTPSEREINCRKGTIRFQDDANSVKSAVELSENFYKNHVSFEGETLDEAIVTKALFCADYAGKIYECSFLYYNVDEVSLESEVSLENESEELLFDKTNSWINDKLGLALSGSMFGTILLFILAYLILRGK